METTLQKRGLYNRRTETPETDDELRETLQAEARSLNESIEVTQELAARVLSDSGRDPKGWPALLNNPDLEPSVAQACDVLRWISAIRQADDLKGEATRDALYRGLQLATCREHLLANIHFEHPVRAHERSVNSIKKTSPFTADEIRQAEKMFERRIDQAAHLGISDRQLRRLRKNLLT